MPRSGVERSLWQRGISPGTRLPRGSSTPSRSNTKPTPSQKNAASVRAEPWRPGDPPPSGWGRDAMESKIDSVARYATASKTDDEELDLPRLGTETAFARLILGNVTSETTAS